MSNKQNNKNVIAIEIASLVLLYSWDMPAFQAFGLALIYNIIIFY